MSGTVRKLPSGRWQAGISRHGRREYRTFETKAAAKTWLARAVPSGLGGSGVTYAAVGADWLEWCRSGLRRQYSESTLDGYRRELALLLHTWGSRPIRGTRQSDIDAWAIDQAEAGIRPATIRNRIGILASLARHALRMDRIPALPCPYERPVLDPTARREPVAEAQLEQLLERADASRDPRIRAVLLLAADAGLRRGEIAQLRRSDLRPGWISVRHDPGEGSRTKSHRGRDVPILTPRLAAALEACAWEERLAIPDVTSPAALDHMLRRALGSSPLHQLRHRFVSWAANGMRIPPWQLHTYAGHTTMQTTLRYYHAEVLRALEPAAHAAHEDGSKSLT